MLDSEDTNPSTTSKGRVLIVDDTLENLRLLSTMLRQQDYEVRCVTSGSAALMGAEADPPDLILMDITMPLMDGYEVCQKLKTNPLTTSIPVMFVSALDDVFDKVKAFNMGAVDYISKPFQQEEVLARIAVHVAIQKLKQQLQEKNYLLEIANQELNRLAELDGLTQVSNRRRFNRQLAQCWQQAGQKQKPLSLILCDVDHFKLYNDTYGHLRGDDCLRQVAAALHRVMTEADCLATCDPGLVARYGGEEFVILLPETDLPSACQRAEMLRQSIEDLQVPHSSSPTANSVTISLGVACLMPCEGQSDQDLLGQADRALYRAKQRGRNQVVCEG